MAKTRLFIVLVLGFLWAGCEPSQPVGTTPDPPEPPGDTAAPPTVPPTQAGQWDTLTLIRTPGAARPTAPSLAAREGRLFVAYQGAVTPGGPPDVFFAERHAGAWTEPVNLSNTATESTVPIVAVDHRGAAHVVWGERTHNPSPRPGSPTDVFYATNESGAWSAPVSLFRSNLEGLSVPRSIGIDSAGTLHLVFSVRDPSRQRVEERFPSKYMRRVGGVWSQPVNIVKGAEPDVAVSRSGKLSVAYIAADSAGAVQTGVDINSVFVVHSDDGGQTWSRPVLVSRSGRFRASQPHIVVDSENVLHVLWHKDLTGDLFADAIWHSRSADGMRWTEPVSIAPSLSGSWGPLRVAVERSGGLDVTFRLSQGSGFPPQPPHPPMSVRWNGSAWTAPEHLFGSTEVGSSIIAVAADRSDSVHVVLSGFDLGPTVGLYHSARRVNIDGQ